MEEIDETKGTKKLNICSQIYLFFKESSNDVK